MKMRFSKVFTMFVAGAILGQAVLPGAFTGIAFADDSSSESKPYKLWYREPSAGNNDPNHADNNVVGHSGVNWNDNGWQNDSMPLGNGYIGANVFGRTNIERVNIAETSLQNPNGAGLNTLMNLYMDFGHNTTTNYYRDLDLNNGIANVRYNYGGVTYEREYLTGYPDNVMAIKLTASQPGAISFDLKPIVPFVRDVANENDYGHTLNQVWPKSASVTADAASKTITLSGTMSAFTTRYEAQVRVINTGGTVTADSWSFNPGTTQRTNDGVTVTVNLGKAYTAQSLKIANANEVVILITAGTNYPLDKENGYTDTDVFIRGGTTGGSVPERLAQYPASAVSAKVTALMTAAAAKGYNGIKAAHIADYKGFFDRATIDLGGNPNDGRATKELRASHNSGNFEPYLEELVFLFGRYLLICSSRVGGFPAHLQGIWNAYEVTPWSGGFWHNINLQMNYWPAFNTNLIDLFTSYADYNEAFRPAARLNADTYLGEPLINTNVRAAVGQGLNGWAIGTGTWPYRAERPQATGHSGPGTGGMTTSLFWEYYDFSRDTTLLKNAVYPAISEMANFLSKTLVKGRDAFLVRESASPEIVENNPNHTHDHHYRTIGAAFDQQMVYDVYETTLRGMEVLRDTYTPAELEGLLGFDQDLFNRAYANYGNMPVYSDPLGSYNPAVLNNPSGTLGNIYTDFEDLLRSQIDYLDPVIIGKSGQIKEFREEEYYGQIGDPTHRHISHLIGLYPGTVINSDTPHWFDAAKITLNGRGDGGTGWAIGHKLNFWARMYDGNRSYVLLRNLIRTSIYDNLLGSHAPFQIDASFGATSGIAEMLLNSHEGYISLLPSRPDQWATGSFAGLTARGAFEVDASWTNHQADRFVIRSKAGEEATLRYFNIAGATVTDQDGKTVQLTAEGTDFITFDTIAGGEYTVTNIPEYTKTESPSNLTLTNSRAGIHMEWQASPDAASYNIYVAEGSQPDYTFLANAGEELNFTVSKTATYADGFTFSDDADQYTFRVTAVAANGRECDGIIHIITPPLTPTAANGIFSNDNVLAVNVTAAPAPSYATIIPNSYKLYERNGAEYAEIAHSDYPVLYAIDTDSAKEYYVAEWNAFSGESGMVRIAIAESLPGSDNIFLGNVPTISFRDDAEIGTTHGSPKNLTNGSRSTARTDDQDTRYELNNTNWNENIMPGGGSDGLNYTRRYFHADFSLAGEESFESITILDWDGTPSHGPLGFDAASDTNFLNSAFSFSLLQNGVWTVVPSSQWTRTQEVTQITPPNSDRPRGERTIEHTFTFNPPLVGDNIRITMGGTPQNRAPSIIHIEGKTLPPVMTNKFALLGLIHDADSVDRQTGFGINWPTAERSQYTIAKQNALTALTSNAADQARIDQSFGDLQDILDQADGLSRAALADLIRQAEQYIEDRSGIEREVAEALIQPALTQAIAIDTAAPQAELDQVHLALHRLSRSFDRADDDIAARIELMDLIEEAKEFIATKIDTESLLHIEELADRISDALDYAETVSAQANPMASLHEILFATRELIATMAAYETAINAELTLSSSGGIFTTSANLTLQCTNSRITDFYYTIDGTDPTPQSDKVSGMVIPLPDGAYTLKAAGFIGTDRVTGIAEGNFFAVKTSNVARGSEATGTGSPFGGDMGPASAVDGNYNSRWATSDASTLTLDLGSVRSVSAVIIREFVEPTQDQRLGNYNIQYLDGDEWETAVSGTGSAARGYQGANYAAATGFVPESITNGLVLREGERHKTYALAFPEAVTSQYFRFNTGAPGATIWEVELYEAPSDDSALADLTISTGELTPEFDSEIYSYSVSVPQATSSITITATARNGGAVVFGAGLRNLVHGENIIDITVTAQDGTSQTVYKIAVTRDNPPAAYRKGDADGDVWITVNDILTVRDHILGKQLTNPQALDAADANSDGIINIFDLLTIRNMIVRERTTQN